MRTKIIGAGSIGNHLAHAARTLGWEVVLCDIDEAALARTRNDIYPARYGQWDEAIALVPCEDAPRGGFDLIAIGTPPDSHMALARGALAESPRALLVEKPLAAPDLDGCQALLEEAEAAGVAAFVGYDHVVAESTTRFAALARGLEDVQTLDVAFREHWQGIFNAHPWLAGPADTYLGFWARGGGALGEHSHALNLWQHIAHEIGAGRVIKVGAMLDYVDAGGADYDRLALLNLRTEGGLVGRVVQDVVTRPPLKWARIQGAEAAIEWQCIAAPYHDEVRQVLAEGAARMERFEKTRPDDFIAEFRHIEAALMQGNADRSPIALRRGLDTMLVIAAAHRSAREGRTITIDYSAGYTEKALAFA